MGEVARRQSRLFGKALGCQVIRIASARRLFDLDQPLADAALEVGIGQTERNSQLTRDPPLGHVLVALDEIEHAEDDVLLALPARARVSLDRRHLGPWSRCVPSPARGGTEVFTM